ncbi:MAG: cytochrome c [Proteobacteria bacterium]|nr:cytochrome c [Pseudomonadota bacterium]
MTRKQIVVASLLFLMPYSLHSEDKHAGETKKETPRASAEKKKPSTLAEKINACLAERPGLKTEKSIPQENAESPEKPAVEPQLAAQAAATAKPNGAPLFQQFCASCHSGGIDPSKAVGKLSAGQMPPAGEAQPSAAEKQALIEYFSGQK